MRWHVGLGLVASFVACSSSGMDLEENAGGGAGDSNGGGRGMEVVGGKGGTGALAVVGGAGGRTSTGGTGGKPPAAGTGGMPAVGGKAGSTPPVLVDMDPAAGNPVGACVVPAGGALESVASPKTVVGNGTPQSCTSQAVVDAVAKGGIITFSCGTAATTIVLARTAKIFNDTGPKIVIDGGSKVTLSGGGKVRILYQNTCDAAQKFTTSRCQDQDSPQLTLQNITFVDGNSKGELTEGGGGGAVFVRGGRLKLVNTRFFRNVCDNGGQDLGGAAVRVLSQHQGLPVFVVNSTFGGKAGLGNSCSNGGGLSGIGVSFTVINSLFSHNQAVGSGANPARAGSPGGGSGGAIYNDGNTFTLSLCGTSVHNNSANEGGGAIFYVSNDRTGSMIIKDSVLTANPSKGFETEGFPGIFVLAKGSPAVSNSTIRN